jgi:hypothetical protein
MIQNKFLTNTSLLFDGIQFILHLQIIIPLLRHIPLSQDPRITAKELSIVPQDSDQDQGAFDLQQPVTNQDPPELYISSLEQPRLINAGTMTVLRGIDV